MWLKLFLSLMPVLFSLLLACSVQAQESAAAYPSKPVTLVVPNSPGASFDRFARMYAQKLGDSLGQPFVVDFKPGAGGTIASTYVAKSAPNGYALLIVSPSFTIAPLQYKDLAFDPVQGFSPISLMTSAPYLLVVNAGLPVKSVREYIAYAKANPGALNIATTGAGSFNHLAAEWIHSATSSKAFYIHYKGGPDYVADLMTGRVQGVIASVTFMKPLIASGKVRAIGVTSLNRNPAVPDLPTLAEQGVPDYNAINWVGIVAAAGTPPSIVAKLNTELAKALKQPDVASELVLDGTQAVASTPEQFRQLLVTELGRWRKLVQEREINMKE
jgi:tripartite-type tricarboxylate transporter receptor subunit TctC